MWSLLHSTSCGACYTRIYNIVIFRTTQIDIILKYWLHTFISAGGGPFAYKYTKMLSCTEGAKAHRAVLQKLSSQQLTRKRQNMVRKVLHCFIDMEFSLAVLSTMANIQIKRRKKKGKGKKQRE